MKTKKIFTGRILALLFLISFFAAHQTHAQEMTKDAWKQAMQEATTKRDQLRRDVENLNKEIERLKAREAQLAEDIQKEETELNTLLAEAKQFEGELDTIESSLAVLEKLNRKQLAKKKKDLDNVQTSITNARTHKLAPLPAYSGRLDGLQQRLDQLRSPGAKQQAATGAGEVIVGTWANDKACLWNIAGKQSVYSNSTLWVKLWLGNKDKISNPDIIHPGQRLRVPAKGPLTAEEIAALREYHTERGTYNEHDFAKIEQK